MTRPLDGIRVIDMSRILAGPSAAQLLGDLGADVIKLERPGTGDDTRGWGPPYLQSSETKGSRESAYYLSANRNKRSLAVDFSKPEGREIVCDLLRKSDVLIENFKVGDLDRKGLGWDSVQAITPQLVYCSITGFGQDGPYAGRSGFDFVIQGMSGLMSLTGEPEGQPMKLGVPISDILAGLYSVSAILAALRTRDRTGLGSHLDISLLDCQVASLFNQSANYLVGGVAPDRHGNAHPNVVPYETVQTADGHITLAVGTDAQFKQLCTLIKFPELAEDERFETNTARLLHRGQLVDILRDAFCSETNAHWIEACNKVGVPCGPINTVPEIFDDSHLQARGLVEPVEHPSMAGPINLVRSPIRMSGTDLGIRRTPPMLGEHTQEILSDVLAYDHERIETLRKRGIVS